MENNETNEKNINTMTSFFTQINKEKNIESNNSNNVIKEGEFNENNIKDQEKKLKWIHLFGDSNLLKKKSNIQNNKENTYIKNEKDNNDLKRNIIDKEKMKNLRFLKKINRNTKEIKQSIRKLNNKKLLRNSSLPNLKDSLYQSLSNFDKRELSYLTPSFKIPMFSALNN